MYSSTFVFRAKKLFAYQQQSFFLAFFLFACSFGWAQPYQAATWTGYNTATQAFPMNGTLLNYTTAATLTNTGLTTHDDSRTVWINPNTAVSLNTATAPYLSYTISTSAALTFDRFVLHGLAILGGSKLQLRWSVDNYASSLGEFTNNGGSYTLTSVSLGSKGSIAAGNIVFRVYFYAATGGGMVFNSHTGPYASLDGTPASYGQYGPGVSIWYSSVACSGTPTAGTASLAAPSGYLGSNAQLSLSGYTNNASGISIQWQQAATSGGTYTDIPSATTASYNTALALTQGTTYYRAKVTCSNSGLSAYSNIVNYTANILAGAGSSISLNGVNQYVDLGSSSALAAANIKTMECWVKFNNLSGDQEILSKSTTGVGIELLLYGNNLAFFCMKDGANGSNISYPASNLQTGIWYHIAATWNGTKESMALYVNGKAVGTRSDFGNINTGITDPAGSFKIGQWSAGVNRYLNATVDEVRIWNAARTTGNIKSGMYGTVSPSTAGLLAYYTMNEVGGTTVVNYSSSVDAANNSNGTLMNSATRTASPVQPNKNALVLDGTDDYVSIGAPLTAASSYTKEAWVYVTKSTATANNIISSQNSPLWISSGTLRAGNNGSTAEIIDATTFPTNTWVHVAVTYNAATHALQLYRNGVLVQSAVSAHAYSGGNNYIGSWFNGTTTESYIGGTIDEVRIWNVVRSQAEIAAKMGTTLSGSETNLVAYYNFNQGLPAGDNAGLRVAIDGTTNNNNGMLMNYSLSGGTSNWITSTAGVISLPVRFLSFTAQSANNSVVLTWATASEQNSQRFEVERSVNGVVYEKIGTVASAGNSTSINHYQYTDATSPKGTVFYRLKQIDVDGNAAYSAVQKVTIDSERFSYTILQNPVANDLRLNIQLAEAKTLTMEVRDARGALLLQRAQRFTKGSNVYALPVTSLTKGMYFITIRAEKGSEAKTFVKQ